MFSWIFGRKGGEAEPQGQTSGGEFPVYEVPNWSVRVTCKPHAYGGSFSVFFFLGPVPSDPEKWFKSPDYVGTFDAYVGDGPRDDDIQGFVYLSEALAKKVSSLKPEVVVPYLQQHLHWGIKTLRGKADHVASLKLMTIMTPFSRPPGSTYPIPGKPTEYPDVIAGRSAYGK